VSIQWKLFCIVHNLWKCMKPLAEKFKKEGRIWKGNLHISGFITVFSKLFSKFIFKIIF
jgi:hypothetical protein